MFNKNSLIFIVCFIFVVAQKSEKQLESTLPCNADSDCVKNSICIGNTVDSAGVCTCKKEFIPKRNRTYYECLPELRNFTTDRCLEDVQCLVAFTLRSECKQNKCVCKQGSHFYDNRCFETVKLGDICKFQQSCLLKNGKIAGCVDGRCQCGNLQHAVSTPDGESCEDNVRLGQECQNNDQCIVPNTQCYGTCRCKVGYTSSSDQMRCLKEADKLFDFCEEDSQCETIGPDIVCEQSRCKCKSRYHSYKGLCYKNTKLNESCNTFEECLLFPELIKYADCKNGICTCIEKYSEDGRSCVQSSAFTLVKNYELITFSIIVFLLLQTISVRL